MLCCVVCMCKRCYKTVFVMSYIVNIEKLNASNTQNDRNSEHLCMWVNVIIDIHGEVYIYIGMLFLLTVDGDLRKCVCVFKKFFVFN